MINLDDPNYHISVETPLSVWQQALATASGLEDEIELRELQEQYVRALLASLGENILNGDISGSFWRVLRATPEQRCQAALAVLQRHR